MSEPGSSGKVGPTPISAVPHGEHDGEQVRPTFHFGAWYLALGDQIFGFHRDKQVEIEGTLTLLYGCLCVSTVLGAFPLQRIAIHSVQPPLPYVEEAPPAAA